MSDATVTVIATITVKPGSEERARQVLQSIVPATLQEPGCLAYDLHQSITDPTAFMFYERWESEAALAGHAASTLPHRTALRQELASLVDGTPQVTRWRAAAG